MTSAPQLITSASNSLLKDLKRLAHDNAAYRKQGRVWLEGDHLCRAASARGVQPEIAVFAESFWEHGGGTEFSHGGKTVLVADNLFCDISGLESPARMGIVMALPPVPAIAPEMPSVILDRVQDAGNVGAILRCASAFGFGQVLALTGTAGLWSPKVLRAGMGAHFGLRLIEGLESPALQALAMPVITTSSHHGEFLHAQQLPWPCAWAFGHEGQGVGDEIASRARLAVRIAQPGGEESLNVATAAAICLHASAAARS